MRIRDKDQICPDNIFDIFYNWTCVSISCSMGLYLTCVCINIQFFLNIKDLVIALVYVKRDFLK
jgi:hypothetical protein